MQTPAPTPMMMFWESASFAFTKLPDPIGTRVSVSTDFPLVPSRVDIAVRVSESAAVTISSLDWRTRAEFSRNRISTSI